jgi:hypothetical protein
VSSARGRATDGAEAAHGVQGPPFGFRTTEAETLRLHRHRHGVSAGSGRRSHRATFAPAIFARTASDSDARARNSLATALLSQG